MRSATSYPFVRKARGRDARRVAFVGVDGRAEERRSHAVLQAALVAALIAVAGCTSASEAPDATVELPDARMDGASSGDAGWYDGGDGDVWSDDGGPSDDAAATTDAGALEDASGDAGVGERRDAGVIDCGSHGSFHVDHCDCDRGYRFDGVTCVVLSACLDDAFEENDFSRDATLWEDAVGPSDDIEELVACPSDVDWLSLPMARGERWEIEARSLGGDLRLRLYAPLSDPRFDGPVATTTGLGGSARVVHTARSAGDALLSVSSTTLDARVTYTVSRRLDVGDADAGMPEADAGAD